MKLLSVLGTKDTQQQELTRKILRTQEVEELATKANAHLARAESDFQTALAQSKETWSLHIEEVQKINKELELETLSLENRKQQALIPISMYKEEVDKQMFEAQEIVKRAKEKEEQADYLQEKLEIKLSEVTDRENILLMEEKSLEVAKRGLQSQQETTKIGVDQLSKQLVVLHVQQQKEEESINQRKKEVSMAEINFNAKLEKYKRDFEALKMWEKQLIDERGTLDREYKRQS